MTPIERVARAVAYATSLQSDSGVMPKWSDFRDEARAAITATQDPLRAWITHQIEHGYAPDGHSVEMTVEYAMGRESAFRATLAEIDKMLEEG